MFTQGSDNDFVLCFYANPVSLMAFKAHRSIRSATGVYSPIHVSK